MKKACILIFSLTLAAVAGAAAFFIIDSQPGFTGVRAKSPDSYTLGIQQMTGSDGHTLDLARGDTLSVQFQTEKGSLHMELTSPDGAVLYSGNGKEATDFRVSIPESGIYTITVKARHAKGKIQIQLLEDTP